MNEHLLKHKLLPAEYEAITKDLMAPMPVDTDYWDNIPTYLIARCPLCNSSYTSQLDTYSLKYWTRPEHGMEVFSSFAQKIGCNHFVRTHDFINLNGLQPTELEDQKTFGVEVPYVHPFWLPDDIPSYAVMHALPICRPEGQQFVPRYSLYIITYYSNNPDEMLNRRWQAARAWSTLLPPENFSDQAEIFDLARWVRARKLQWLDPLDPDLPLRTRPVELFPYLNIKGSIEQRIFYPDNVDSGVRTDIRERSLDYLAVEVDLGLEEFCDKLRQGLGLPEFVYDGENETEWGEAHLGHISFNVSRPYEEGKLQEWDQTVPLGCNFGISITISNEAPWKWDIAWSYNTLIPKCAQIIANVIGSNVFYHRTLRLTPIRQNIKRSIRYSPDNKRMGQDLRDHSDSTRI
ncbi:MAG: hypothetical protein KJ077_37455 [Anaerolineae bacterium]|nr:hypothetical protein [Anaerolineae bacterium]